MPSKNTSILAARIKDEDIVRLTNAADSANLTVPRLLHIVAEGLYRGDIYIDGDEVKGVTPDEIDISRLKEVAKRYKKSPQEVLDTILEQSVNY